MQDTSSLEYSLTATVCLESQQVLKLRQLVSTDDFSIPACATVFGAADSAVSRGKAFDANIAADGLRGLVDAPRKFLAECIDVTPTVAHAEEYARLLHTRAAEKRLRDGVLAALDEGNPATAIAELCKAFLLDNAGGRLKSVSQALTETLQSLSVQEQARIDTGFPKLDSILKGFEGGQLIIVGARPGVGKSAFLLDLAESAARAGNETLFVSLEMNASELTERLLVRRSMATMDELIDRDLTDELWDDIVTPGVGTVVGMGLGLILGLSIYSVRKDPKKGTQRLVSIGRSVLLGLLAGVLGVGLAALGIVSAGTAFIISAAIGLALKFFVDSVDDSKVRKATSGFTGTRVSTKAPTRRRRVAAQSLDGNAPVYNDIPQLAHGAVIPPNKEFLAVLGDQKSGTNIETPLATMVDAFKQAMAESGGGATTVVIQLDGKEIARSTVKNINNMTRAAGKPVLLY